MADQVSATLEGYDREFSTGTCLLDCQVTLGQNDMSSTCTLTVADPKGEIAQALINHSLLSGGIQKLQAPSAVPSSTSPPVANSGATGQIAGGDGGNGVVVGADPKFTPEIKAFMDLIAYKEVPIPLGIKGYYANNGVAGNQGYFSEDAAKQGFPFPTLSPLWNVGRYQFSYDEYLEVVKNPANNVKAYTPIDQDYMCYWRMNQRGCVAALQRGDIAGAIQRGGQEWASLPGSPYGQVQAGYSVDKAIAYYNQRLAYYKGGAQPPAKVDPTATPAATTPSAPVVADSSGAAPVKGNKLVVTIGEDVFTYYHQSTEYDADNGKTTIGGQSIRYALDRRKRNRVVHNVSLKDFATNVATAHGVPLNWMVSGDIQFEHIDQKGLSDYAILLQQAKQSGYFVSDDSSGITVKPLSAIEDSGLVFQWHRDILSAKFKDEALDATKVDASSALLQGENKASIDPGSGSMVTSKPDVDKVADNSVTGDKSPIVSGKPVPGQELIQDQNRSRVKRVQGLPSTLVVPMSEQTRKLKPLSTVKTEDFPDVLNRLWVCDNIKHEPFKGTTTLNVYSPIEVLDLTPQATAAAPGAPVTSTAPIGQNATGYIYPCTNVYPFSDYGQWHKQREGGHVHAGVDFAGGDGGGTIVAIADGICQNYPNSTGGYGNYVDIDHGNGVCSRYAHMASITCANGQQIKQGQEVGKVGSTGHSTGPHLHFETFKKGHEFGPDTINPATLPGLSRCGIVGQSVQVGQKD